MPVLMDIDLSTSFIIKIIILIDSKYLKRSL